MSKPAKPAAKRKAAHAAAKSAARRIVPANASREEREVAALKQELVVCRARLAALEAEIHRHGWLLHRLRNRGLFRRIARAIWNLPSLPWRIRLRRGLRLEPVPGDDLERGEVEGSFTRWTMTGDDARFQLTWRDARALPAGHYAFSIEVSDGFDQLRVPRLYVDSGSGYRDAEMIDLRLESSGASTYQTLLTLPQGAQRLRLDPSIVPGAVSLGTISLRRLARTHYYAKLAWRLMAPVVSDRQTFYYSTRRAWEILRDKGPQGLAEALRRAHTRGHYAPGDYQSWIAFNDVVTEEAAAALREDLDSVISAPLVSVVMPVYDTSETLLREAIESVRSQIYENWELCIADDCSGKSHVKKILSDYAARDGRIKVTFRQENGHISRASNSAFALASGEWIALLDHDDVLHPHALAQVVLEIARHPETELIYTDEDKLDSEGRRYDPYFKPDYSRELFRSQNYFNHLTVHRAANIHAVGGWRDGFEGSQDYDLNLRIVERIDAETIRHIPRVLYHWRATPDSTAKSGARKSYAFAAGLRALEEHLKRTKLPAQVEEAPETPFYRLRHKVPDPQPLVSLIIPTRDRADLLRGCIGSILEKTKYESYEILIVDNGSEDADTLVYLDELRSLPNVSVISYEKPFNYSAINNSAVEKASGSIVGLVNNDIKVISPDWLSEMVSWAAQPDVGCVGAKLYYANDTIQHAGVILGLGGIAGHSHKYFPRDHPGAFFRLKVVQNLSAVTAACLLVRKEIYEEVGGLNHKDLRIAFNDVDFCLRVAEAGYWNVWTPYAELYHLESVSRGFEDNPERQARFRSEVAYMRGKWEHILGNDPFYSPNLTRDREDFSF